MDKITELTEKRFVFFDEEIKKLIEDRRLGVIKENSEYGNFESPFEANIIYQNKKGQVMMANDYFHNKEVSSFSPKDGISIGYMIDNWSPRDRVYYEEKPVPEEIIKKLEGLDLSVSGYSKKAWEDKIQTLIDKIAESDEILPGIIKELETNLAIYYHMCLTGEPFNGESSWENIENIPFGPEEERIKPLFPLNRGGYIEGIKFTKAEKEDPKILFYDTENDTIPFEEMSPEGMIELVDLIIENSYHGPTIKN